MFVSVNGRALFPAIACARKLLAYDLPFAQELFLSDARLGKGLLNRP
jgi:hypothetical protein